MKFIITLFISFFTLSVNAQLFVKGIIKNANHEKLFIFLPINGYYNDFFLLPNSRIEVSKNNYFEKQLALNCSNMFCLSVGLRRIYFYGEPGDTINVEIDANKFSSISPNGGLKFIGKNSKGNEYFNLFNWQSGSKFGAYEDIVEDSLHFHNTKDLHAMDFALKKVTAYFDTLLVRKQISKGFYNSVVPGIKAVLVTREIRYLLVEQNKMSFSQALTQAGLIYKRYPVEFDMLKRSVFGNTIAYYYYKTLAAKAMHANSEHLTDSIIAINGKNILIKNSFVYWLYAPRDIQETYWARNLIDLKKYFATKYDSKDVEAFLMRYPKSLYKNFLISAFKKYMPATNQRDSNLIKILKDSSKSLDDLIACHFKGKKIYIDLWASWCLPCKQEFQYNATVDSFCNKYNITRLYISFDGITLHKSMLNDIYAYNLKGFHVQANESMYKDIIHNLYSDEEFYIPRYLLVNENSEIINKNALRPSSGNSLFEDIKKSLNLKD